MTLPRRKSSTARRWACRFQKRAARSCWTSPGTTILIYAKLDHSPASFTILNFPVDYIDEAVDELTSRGVSIQRYEGFNTDDKGVVHGEGRSVAWFTDPAGNVLSVVQ